MTIAAGFRFAEGLLICADSEITHGDQLKKTGSKIFPYEFKKSGNKAVFTYSGDVFLSKQCIRRIAHALAVHQNKMALTEMFEVVEKQVYEFHADYIFKHPHYHYNSGPQVNLIVGVWSATDKALALYQTNEHSLIEIPDIEPFAVTGNGQSFAAYIIKPLVPHEHMKLSDLVTVATYAIKEAKDNVPYVGKSTELITINQNGEIGNIGWLSSSHVESFTEAFAMAIKHLFVETCDLDCPDDQLQKRFESLWAVIMATRQHLTRERKQGEGFAALVDMMVKRKVTQL